MTPQQSTRRPFRSVAILSLFGSLIILSSLLFLSIIGTKEHHISSDQQHRDGSNNIVLNELKSFRQSGRIKGQKIVSSTDLRTSLQKMTNEQKFEGSISEHDQSTQHDAATSAEIVQPTQAHSSATSIAQRALHLNDAVMGEGVATEFKQIRIRKDDDSASFTNRSAIRNPLLQPSTNSQKLSLKLDVEYLGVLLDAGRHYFPIPWIYQLIDHLELLGYNLLHFRLTDDQAFNIRLDSHPELAQPAEGSEGKVYSTTELRELVSYAQSKNIMVMPEINVPGHAGGWAGVIPLLVVPCASFICSKGYGLPLNVSHPLLLPLLKDVIREIKDIFSTSPFLHLGGDELEMSRDCFSELGEDMLDYNKFERDLGQLLDELDISQDNIVRWEMTGQDSVEAVTSRVKGIDHYWYSRGYQDLNSSDTKTSNEPRVFCSQGLYFDSNVQEDGWTAYKNAKTMLLHKYEPIAIIAGAFELGVGYWFDRNILGRLLAVALGASNENYSEELKFLSRYQELCVLLDFPGEMCSKAGVPMIPEEDYKDDWRKTTATWRENLCQRLAIREIRPILVTSARRSDIVVKQANNIFWNNFPQALQADSVGVFATNVTVHDDFERPAELHQISNHTVRHTGIILDLVEDGRYSRDKVMRIIAILDYMSHLGFNTLQLRIMTDYSFAVKLASHDKITFGPKIAAFRPYDMVAIEEIIDHASMVGIQVIPELTVVHRAGGWFNAAVMAQCPRYHCEQNKGLTLDIGSGSVFPTLSSVLRELRSAFTSPFVHLGYDERKESLVCLKEAKIEPNFDKFEAKIARLLKYDNIPLDKVLRWENEEQVLYKNRTGTITHYHKGVPNASAANGGFFISTGLHLNDPSSKLQTGWDLYQQVQKLTALKPLGVLASLVTFADSNLKNLNIRQRLLATSIGLSIDGLSELEFEEVFTETCEGAKNKGCRLFGRVRNGDVAAIAMQEQLQYKQENICRSRLQNMTETRPREGVLVEVGTDTYKMARLLNDYF